MTPSLTPSFRSHASSAACVDGRIFLGRNVASGRAVHDSMQHQAHGVHARSHVRWSARDDRVEVGRIHRRERQSLIAASGAAVPQRCGRLFAVIRADDGFCVNGQLMQRSMRVIDELLRMPDRERRAGRRVAAVRARRRVAERDGGRERLVADRARPSAVADCLQFAVPAGCRQPHFNFDVRIGRRLARQRDTTERRRCCHRAGEGRRNASARNSRRRSKCACRDGSRGRDGRILQPQGGQPLARHGRGGWTLLHGREQREKNGDSCDPERRIRAP